MCHLANSREAYQDGIRQVLPDTEVVRDLLNAIRLFDEAGSQPPRGESLTNWLARAARAAGGAVPLTLVIGETVSRYRKPRGEAGPREMVMACTSDGVGGATAVVGMLQLLSDPRQVDFRGVVDEWSDFARLAPESHLVVVGTPEVNICATFLHGLVRDCYFGRDGWPPDLASTAESLYLRGETHPRILFGDTSSDCGGVFLLANPWAPDKRVLWIAGLSGHATSMGCSLVASGWAKNEELAGSSLGTVYYRERTRIELAVDPQYWLSWKGSGVVWESTGVAAERHSRPKLFISYSHKDEVFCKQLYSRLCEEHLPAWFASVNMRSGQKIHEQIDEAIRVHDKLLLVLSEQSMASEWVKTEVRRARKREVREGRRVLFPIRLVPFESIRDWEAFDADTGKDMAVEVREYFIPDFSNWENERAFDEAFQRLVEDLRTPDGQ